MLHLVFFTICLKEQHIPYNTLGDKITHTHGRFSQKAVFLDKAEGVLNTTSGASRKFNLLDEIFSKPPFLLCVPLKACCGGNRLRNSSQGVCYLDYITEDHS